MESKNPELKPNIGQVNRNLNLVQIPETTFQNYVQG